MSTGLVELRPLNLETIKLKIIGDSELIVHAWSEKAKKEMLAAQQKKKVPKEIRDPEKEYKAAFYVIDPKQEIYGFPALAMNVAIIEAAHKNIGIEKTLVKKAIRILGNHYVKGMHLLTIHGSKGEMREDMVRIGMGSADLRYRPMFFPWHMEFMVRYDADLVSSETVVNLINRTGFGVGLGEWRPERKGVSGTFHVEVQSLG